MAKQRRSKRGTKYVLGSEEEEKPTEPLSEEDPVEHADVSGDSDFVPEDSIATHEQDEDAAVDATIVDPTLPSSATSPSHSKSKSDLYTEEDLDFCNGTPVEVESISGKTFSSYDEFCAFLDTYSKETFQVNAYIQNMSSHLKYLFYFNHVLDVSSSDDYIC